MNGILGSFHTNSHDISLQIMRRYMSCQCVSVAHWPPDFKRQFAPLLCGHFFEEGSLKAHSLTQALNDFNTDDLNVIPPVSESAWQLADKEELAYLLTLFIGHEEYTLLLHTAFIVPKSICSNCWGVCAWISFESACYKVPCNGYSSSLS